MPCGSQIVSIDTVQKTTTLDKKATIAIGNQLKEGSGYKELFKEQGELVDSLYKEIGLRKEEVRIYELEIVPALEQLNVEKDNEKRHLIFKQGVLNQSYQDNIKKLKGRFWKGLGWGAAIAGAIFTAISLR